METHVFGDGLSLRFEAPRYGRAINAKKVMQIGHYIFALSSKDRLLFFNMNRSRHISTRSKNAEPYIEGAYRLGLIKKAIFDRLNDRWQKMEKSKAQYQAAWEVMQNIEKAGVKLPKEILDQIQKLADKF